MSRCHDDVQRNHHRRGLRGHGIVGLVTGAGDSGVTVERSTGKPPTDFANQIIV